MLMFFLHVLTPLRNQRIEFILQRDYSVTDKTQNPTSLPWCSALSPSPNSSECAMLLLASKQYQVVHINKLLVVPRVCTDFFPLPTI